MCVERVHASVHLKNWYIFYVTNVVGGWVYKYLIIPGT